MPGRPEELRLFDAERDLLSTEALEDSAKAAVDGSPQPELDSARMWRSKHDGLLVRGVKPHSAHKSSLVSRGIGTVTSAMADKWFTKEHGLQYVELYSGPGRLLDEATAKEQPGSPLQALGVKRPFTKYVFSDFSPVCTEALDERTRDFENVSVLCGDANDRNHLERVVGELNRDALVIAYLDPARPRDLRWATIEFLASRLNFVDLIINLPVNSIVRAILGAHGGGGTGPGAAGLLIDHASPYDLLAWSPTGKFLMAASMDNVRQHFDGRLESLGFLPPRRRTVEFPAGNPYYDILLASRHERGGDLWDKTNPPPVDGQTSLLDFL